MDKQTFDKLQAQVNKYTDDIKELQQNVKWLYKYGGTGSGTGGDGSAPDTSGRIYKLVYTGDYMTVTVDQGTVITETIFPEPGLHNFDFTARYLSKDHEYSIQYDDTGTGWKDTRLSELNDFTLSVNIKDNCVLKVRIYDKTESTSATLNLRCITTPVQVTTKLIGTLRTGDIELSGEVFMENYDDIRLRITYTPYIEGKFHAEAEGLIPIEDNNVEVEKTVTNDQIIFTREFLTDRSNTGPYTVEYKTVFTGNNGTIKSQNLTNSITLIPNSIYVILSTPDGTLYTSKQTNLDTTFKFPAGAVTFNGVIYEGSNNGDSYDSIKVSIWRHNDDGTKEKIHDFTTIQPQAERLNFFAGTNGVYYFDNSIIEPHGNWFEVITTVTKNAISQSVSQSYWLFVQRNSNILNWYPVNENGETVPLSLNVYFNKQNDNTDDFTSIDGTEIKSYINIVPKTYGWAPELNPTTSPEILIAIAIKLEADNAGIYMAKLENRTKENTFLHIYQNKILVEQNEIEIYYPMDDKYHLLQIYQRVVQQLDQTSFLYEWVVYIDGVIEGALPTFQSISYNYKNITFNPTQEGSFTVNHFGYTIFDVSDYKRWHGALYKGMNDINIVEYYYKYLCATNTEYKEADFAQEINDFKQVYYSYDKDKAYVQDSLAKIDANAANTIITYAGIPCVLLELDDTNIQLLLTEMNNAYGEEEETDTITISNLRYYPANSTKNSEPYVTTDITYHFEMDIQGSSTKGFKHKNWEISIVSDTENTTAIYSLNYDGTETAQSYFPEQSFTFKTDIVDSAHSNNTAIGDFINAVSTPFNPGYRNCLTGTPVLMFAKHNDTYYVLGLYNYNLGRKSKYNLNYSNRPLLENKARGFIISTTLSTQVKDTYASAEIQNNSCFWDFSQYDDSIMFINSYLLADGSTPTGEFIKTHPDTYYMWGDLLYNNKYNINLGLKNFVKSVTRAGGFLFKWLGKEFDDSAYISSLENTSESATSTSYHVHNNVPNAYSQYVRKIKQKGDSYIYIFEKKNEREPEFTAQDLIDCIYGTFNEDGTVNKVPYVNYQSVLEYYVIDQAFGLIDSVQKNLNVKTWNGTTYNAAFYDMDTGLELDNSGSLTISPFAFSDFWETNEYGIVSRHLDYWPHSEEGEAGFDVPSSYLFAIAKYASYYSQVHLTQYDKILSPTELWAKYRSNNGELRNAQWFVDNYFNKKFEHVKPIIWNMNYRAKYLVQEYIDYTNSSTFNNNQFKKFHGRRLHRVKDWLENRLHMLDAYFNINNLSYAPEGNSDITLKITEPITEVANLQSNPDVILLQNIFSSDSKGGIKAESNMSCTIRALDYSPFITKTTSTTSDVRLFYKGKEYYVFAQLLNQSFTPYGCSRWTYMDSINSFIQNKAPFYINNKYITNITASFTKPLTGSEKFSPSSWSFYTPKLQTLSLTANTYSGTVKVYPGTSLTSLNLSNTACTFTSYTDSDTVNKCEFLKYVNLTNFKGSISLTKCINLETLIIDNAYINTLEVNPYLGDCNFTRTHIKTLSITSLKDDASFYLDDDDMLESLTITGFKNVTIKRCPKLRTLSIIDSEKTKLKTLTINNCPNDITVYGTRVLDKKLDLTSLTSLTLNSTRFNDTKINEITLGESLESITSCIDIADGSYTLDMTLNLTHCVNLKSFNLYRSMFKIVDFGTERQTELGTDTTNRVYGSFINTLKGNFKIKTASGVFQDCTELTTINGTLTFDSNITDISYMCYRCSSLADISLFVTGLMSISNKITNISYAFAGTKVKDYSRFLSLPFDNVRQLTGAIKSLNDVEITTIFTKEHLNFPAAEEEPISIFRGYDVYSKTIKFEPEALAYYPNKFTTIDFDKVIINIANISNMSFFTKATSCKVLKNVIFNNPETPTFITFPKDSNTHIEEFENVLNQNYGNNNSELRIRTSTFNNYLKIAKRIERSFNGITVVNSSELETTQSNNILIAETFDYDNLIAGAEKSTNGQLFSSDFSNNKQVSAKDFKTILLKIFKSKVKLALSVFNNCEILCEEDDITAQTGTLDIYFDDENTTITNISNMFRRCHCVYIDRNSETPVIERIYLRFLSKNPTTGKHEDGFSILTNLQNCQAAWYDSYIYKLSSSWFTNKSILVNISSAFAYTRFFYSFSDDVCQDKIPYHLSPKVMFNDQSSQEVKTGTLINRDYFNSDQYEVQREEDVLYTLDETNVERAHYIIPQQFLYYIDGDRNQVSKFNTKQQSDMSNLFMYSTLIGLLPDTLLANRAKSNAKTDNMFQGTTILPYLERTIFQGVKKNAIDETKDFPFNHYYIYEVNIYCVVPNGDIKYKKVEIPQDPIYNEETGEYIPQEPITKDVIDYYTGYVEVTDTALGNMLNGCLIVPTIHQDDETYILSTDITQLSYLNPDDFENNPIHFEFEAHVGDSTQDDGFDIHKYIQIPTIDYIYQYNQYSLTKNINAQTKNLTNAIPDVFGLRQSYAALISQIDHWGNYFDNVRHGNTSQYPVTGNFIFKYNPLDNKFRIHYGTQYNNGNNVLCVDGFNKDDIYAQTNTDGFNGGTANNRLVAKNCLNKYAALIMFGPIFQLWQCVAKEIEDTAVVVPESYTHSSYGAGVYGGVTNNITAPGYRFYQPNPSERIYYACDVSKNVYFPRAANRGANIRYIIQGRVWTSTDSNRYTYKVYEQINQYGEGNYSTIVSLYL